MDNPVKASWDIGTLSYAGMLSLPGFSFSDFYQEHYGKQMPSYLRPTRREIAQYFATYPTKVGISDAIYNKQNLSGICRTDTGFYIASHGISCRHLILASGVFTSLIPPRPLLLPLNSLPGPYQSSSSDPVLVLGSGFSAADVIISSPPDQKIIHIYKWAPSTSPSPLRGCHQHAYPEYAGVYRKMKLAAISGIKKTKQSTIKTLSARRTSVTAFDQSRDWNEIYEGLPNTVITDVNLNADHKSATVTFHNDSDGTFTRQVSGLAYVIGRRGSLEYLESPLQREVCPKFDPVNGLSGRDMREQANKDLEVTSNVFITGSLTGDTLIRFAYGGCVYAAGKIMERQAVDNTTTQENLGRICSHFSKNANGKAGSHSSLMNSRYVKSMNGFDGHLPYSKPQDDVNGVRRANMMVVRQESTIDWSDSLERSESSEV